MKILGFITLLFLLSGCGREHATAFKSSSDTNAATPIEPPSAAAPSEKALPTWYVFRIKAFQKVDYNDDRTSAIIEGVTLKDKDFKVKVLWDATFKGNHQRCVDEWLKRSKGDFEAGLPYIIAGTVISRDPLTIKPDTVVDKAPNFGAPAENEY